MGVSEELILHETYSKEWDIDLSKNYIKKATKNYTDFLDDTSKTLSSVEIMFAMTPCMRLYSWIGKSLYKEDFDCLLYTSPSPRDISGARMPSSA